MKLFTFRVAILMSEIALASAVSVFAQQVNAPANNPDNTTVTTPATSAAGDTAGLNKLDAKTGNATVRASRLIGANLKNSNDESVGEIKDLVLDAATGKIRYAAVTYGGFLGVGSKLYAVPFEAFRVRQNTSSVTPGDYTLTLDVTKEQLKGDQGFDNEHWPDFANASFTADLDRRYNINRGQNRR